MPGTVVGRLLLVDDEPDILETVKTLLELELPDVAVAVAATGEAALEMLHQGRFDVMVTDYRMPGMDGATLAKEAARLWPEMALLMVTAYVDAKTLQEIRERAPDLEVLPKPLVVEEFIAKVRGKFAGSPDRRRDAAGS